MEIIARNVSSRVWLVPLLQSSRASWWYGKGSRARNPGGVVFCQKAREFRKNVATSSTVYDVEKWGVELLAARAYTAVELRKKLVGKRFPPTFVDHVISDFQSRGFINDSLYAETFSRSRFSSSCWGPLRIKQALFKKGISEVDAENAIKLVFEEGGSEEHESNLGLSKLSMDHLLTQASKQWLRGEGIPKETRKARIIRWLQYRGFNWAVISSVLKKLESQYPT